MPMVSSVLGTPSPLVSTSWLIIMSLEPKPGLRFGKSSVQPVVPDVLVRQRPDTSWLIELNNDTLPKVLVNQAYYATVSKTATPTPSAGSSGVASGRVTSEKR